MMTRSHLIAVLTLVGLGAFAVGPARATVLVPDRDPNWSGGYAVPDTYGDHVTAASMPSPDGHTYKYEKGEGWTPNITATYAVDGSGTNACYYGTGYGVNPVFFSPTGTFEVTLTPESGYCAVLHAFTAATYGANAGYTADFYVYDGKDLLWKSVDHLIKGTKTFQAADFGDRPLTSSAGQALRLVIKNIADDGPNPSYMGFANISFLQATSESTTDPPASAGGSGHGATDSREGAAGRE